MRKAKLWALAGLPFVLAACGGGDEAAMEEAPEIEMTEPAVPVEPAGEMAGMASTITMQALGESGASGEITVTPQGTQAEVMVRLTGLQEGEHPGHIHSGTCDNIGGVVAPLQPITAGADGTGTMTTTVDVDPATLLNGQHVIQYHQAGGGPGIVCGQLTGHSM